MRHGPADSAAAVRLRQSLLAVLAIGLIGTAADLLLIEHYESPWQAPPLVLIAAALPLVVWLFLRSARAGWVAILMLRITMVLFLGAGLLGVLLHYKANRTTQTERDASVSGWALFVGVMTAKSPPALAPGVMVQLGLLGLVYTFRHPSLSAPHYEVEPSSDSDS